MALCLNDNIKNRPMDIRDTIHPEHAKALDTEGLRAHFHISGLFAPDAMNMTYTHYDRVIVFGVCPVSGTVEAPNDVSDVTGTDFLLQRREMGIINIGGPGKVDVDGETYRLARQEGLYIGAGARNIVFSSDDAAHPAKFYGNCAPAHTHYPNKHVTIEEASPVTLGARETNNERTIYRYLHPKVMPSCQLLMGLTKLAPGSNWNTMPPHLHDRRMEVYVYFDMAPEAVVFHMMGKPQETRHIVVRNEEAVISPPWSIHSGCGTLGDVRRKPGFRGHGHGAAAGPDVINV